MGFGVVLELIWMSKAKEPICGNLCFTNVILLFSGVVGSHLGSRKKENGVRIRSGFQVGFVTILALFWEVF